MKRPELQTLRIILAMVIALFGSVAQAQPMTQTEIHDQAEPSLVKLSVTGLATVGPQINDPVTSVGSGFLVGEGGYILTTAHFFDPLKKVFAVDTKITAEVSGMGQVDVLYISEVSSLDLVLLRAFKPRGKEFPPSLDIGSSKDVTNVHKDNGLMYSGWDETNYNRGSLGFNTDTTQLVPYAWTLKGEIQGGQSGSPVYIDRDGKPLVVGLLKATSRNNQTLALMIPIENSFQLIGQFKMREMQKEIEVLREIVGRNEEAEHPPLTDRVGGLENSLDQIEASFTWSAESNDNDGSIIVKYEKIISDGPHVDEIAVKIQPFLYVVDEADEDRIGVTGVPTWRAIKQSRLILEDGDRVGKFVLPGIRKRLTDVIQNADGTLKNQEPFRDIVLKLSATIDDVPFREQLTIVPKYSWVYDD